MGRPAPLLALALCAICWACGAGVANGRALLAPAAVPKDIMAALLAKFPAASFFKMSCENAGVKIMDNTKQITLLVPSDDAFYTTMNPAASLSLPYDYWRNATTLANMIKRHVIVTNKTNVGTMTSFKNATFADPGGNCTVRYMNATALNVSSCNPMLPMVKVVNKGFFISSVYVQIIDWVLVAPYAAAPVKPKFKRPGGPIPSSQSGRNSTNSTSPPALPPPPVLDCTATGPFLAGVNATKADGSEGPKFLPAMEAYFAGCNITVPHSQVAAAVAQLRGDAFNWWFYMLRKDGLDPTPTWDGFKTAFAVGIPRPLPSPKKAPSPPPKKAPSPSPKKAPSPPSKKAPSPSPKAGKRLLR